MRSKAFFLRSQLMTARPRNCLVRTHPPMTFLSTSTNDAGSSSGITQKARLPLWIDTDVGFDDLVAIGCRYGAPPASGASSPCQSGGVPKDHEGMDKGNTTTTPLPLLAGISTVGGGLTSDPWEGVQILKALLPKHSEGTHPAIPIVAGKSGTARALPGESPGREEGLLPATMMEEDPPWLDTCRDQMKELCASEGILMDSCHTKINRTTNDNDDTNDAEDEAAVVLRSKRIEETPHGGDDRMDLVCLGPLTNLAHWLEEMPGSAADRWNSIWILGGNLPTVGNSKTDGNQTNNDAVQEEELPAEFNFSRDPQAVRAVLHHAGLHNTPIYIVPQEVCDRSAFEASFFESSSQDTANPNDSRAKLQSAAASIIEDWLESSPSRWQSQSHDEVEPQSLQETCNATGGVRSPSMAPVATISSMLPPWMVRLIRKRTFSVYGDPICLYVRDHTCNSNSNGGENNNRNRRPRILWKDYSTRSSSSSNTNRVNHETLAVDSKGRLILQVDDSNEMAETRGAGMTDRSSARIPKSGDLDEEADSGITIRIAHEVELGSVYLDWLTRSLVSSLAVK